MVYETKHPHLLLVHAATQQSQRFAGKSSFHGTGASMCPLPDGKEQYQLGFRRTCQIGKCSAGLLSRHPYTADFPFGQSCCVCRRDSAADRFRIDSAHNLIKFCASHKRYLANGPLAVRKKDETCLNGRPMYFEETTKPDEPDHNRWGSLALSFLNKSKRKDCIK